MLERFRLLMKLQEKEGKTKKVVRHIALTMHGMEIWAEQKKTDLKKVYEESFNTLREIISFQVKKNIPILTIYVLPEQLKDEGKFPVFLDELIRFLNSIKSQSLLHDNKIKVSALGKWYDIPGRAVDAIKDIVSETKDYDAFFVNLCINYNGREEIVDACKIIARQIKAGKIDIEAIDKNLIKENSYTSYFLPPDMIIKNGKVRQCTTFLLWDMPYAKIYFTDKYFPDFKKSDFSKALDSYSQES